MYKCIGCNTAATQSDTNLNLNFNNDDYDFRIGNNWSLGATWTSVIYKHYMRGYVDDIRWTNFCRYNSTDFSVPTQAYPIAPDAPPTVDPNWSNVKMRLPFDSSLNDISSYAEAGTANNTSSGLVNTTVKYGSNSLRFIDHNHFVWFGDASSATAGAYHLNFRGTWTIEF